MSSQNVTKRSMYVFSDASAQGINTVPVKRMVLIESTGEIYFLDNKTNVGPGTTIQDAINPQAGTGIRNLIPPNNVWSYNNQGVGTNMDAALWGGHRLINISVNEPQPSDGVVGDIWFQRDA